MLGLRALPLHAYTVHSLLSGAATSVFSELHTNGQLLGRAFQCIKNQVKQARDVKAMAV